VAGNHEAQNKITAEVYPSYVNYFNIRRHCTVFAQGVCVFRVCCVRFLISSNKHIVVLMETKLLLYGKGTGTLFILTSCCRRLACGILNAVTMCLMLRLVLYNLVITFYIAVLRGQYLQLYFPLEFKKKHSIWRVLLESK
jgi:hypothetical protein